MNLSAIQAFLIEERVKKKYQEAGTKSALEINRISELSMLMTINNGLFIKNKAKEGIEAFV